jgi:metal-sulfur cluster biosynthetic enzyme
MQNVQDKEKEVFTVLEQCFDPEIPNVSIVDLGLIYDVSIQEEAVNIKMTLTARGCGMAGMISDQVKMMVQDIPWVKTANVEIVWEPPWHPDRMSEKAKKTLGFDL